MKHLCLLVLVLALTLGVASLSPTQAQTETILHNFDDGSVSNDGDDSACLIQGTDGNFYGTCFAGGQPIDTANPFNSGTGVIYKMTPSGTYTTLHQFAPVIPTSSIGANSDGIGPGTLVEGNDGNFYGVTDTGGALNSGTIFRITPEGVFSTLHVFGDGTVLDDGIAPNYLVLGNDGNFYGTTGEGGTTAVSIDPGHHGYGTAFKMTPSGTMTILHNFGDGSVADDGLGPGAFFLGSDGNFYGTTVEGGTAQDGTIFRMTPSGIVTTLHNPGDGSVPDANPATSVSSFIQGSDGNFYGTSFGGGSTVSTDPYHYGGGYVFKMTPSGRVTILHSFGDGSVPNDGLRPSLLIQGTDGNLYGFTMEGGATATNRYNGDGTMFQITLSGAVTILHSFDDGTVANDGQFGLALVAGSDGNLFGTTWYGGSTTALDSNHIGYGTIFQLTAPNPIWEPLQAAACADGTSRLLWTRTDGAAGVWTFSADDAATAAGPVYGPFTHWSAKNVATAKDATSRLLWTNSDGAAGLWTLDALGTETSVGPAYGPYTGWTAVSLATAPDGTSRILWTRTDGAAGVWTFTAGNAAVSAGPVYGPFLGWTAKAVGAVDDGTSRVLWSRTDGAAGLWTLNAGDAVQSIGAAYGPFSDSHGTWSAAGMGASADGTAQVLWNRSDGATGLWTFSADDTAVTAGPVYGPYAGYTAATVDAASDQARVLWVRSDGAAGLWSLGSNDAISVIGSVYGPF